MGQSMMSRNAFLPVLRAGESNLNVIALGKGLLAAADLEEDITWQMASHGRKATKGLGGGEYKQERQTHSCDQEPTSKMATLVHSLVPS